MREPTGHTTVCRLEVVYDAELGPVRTSALRFLGSGRRPGRQPPPPQSAPPSWLLVLAAEGSLTLATHSGSTRIAPGEVMLWDETWPLRSSVLAAGHGTGGASGARDGAAGATVLLLRLPEATLPVPRRTLRRLAALPVPTDSGPAALLRRLLEEFAHRPTTDTYAQRVWLGRAAVDLVVAFVAGGPLRDRPVPQRDELPRPRQAQLTQRVMAYIERHLTDPDLSPGEIARAHHISVRYLHHLFQQEEWTVGGFVRIRRLERSRTDLGDPGLADHSVDAIRARCGFRDAAVFGRTFKKQYGVTPGEYRRISAA
ncbi:MULTISPECIES: helix-turn-helix domain-containing protein [unclassified Streptomyces]|uniref:helix-turn-helix domain-containing protein n=1 Tax=unclassified Streptomyces TaxID=2593676 RepID=UPI00278C6C01|nr:MULTISPECIES: helix-turn-helix domain-containing protein [unclassified Streptomyces]